VAESNYSPGWVLLGAFAVEVALIAALAWLLSRAAAPLSRWRPARVASALLLVTSLTWFFWRLKS
jgi:hypothetical protein